MRPLMSPSLLGFLTRRTLRSRWSFRYRSRSSFSSSEETQQGVRWQDQEEDQEEDQDQDSPSSLWSSTRMISCNR